MDRIRFALWFGVLASIWISYTTWVAENQPDPATLPPQPASAVTDSDDDSLPTISSGSGADLPEVAQGDGDTIPAPAAQNGAAPTRSVRVRTDVLDLVIDLDGGDLVRADLLEYPVNKSDPDTLVRLLDYDPATRWVYQTGILSGGEGQASPDHQQQFRAEQDVYELGSADELVVRLDWAGGGDGLEASKVYRFQRGQYGIELELVLENRGTEAWQGYAYAQMRRIHNPRERKYLDVDSYSFTGPALYNGDEFQTLDFDDLLESNQTQTVTGGWYASIQHHFLAAAVPPVEEPTELRAAASGNRYTLTALSERKSVAPGAALRYPVELFVGPKLQDQLDEAADKLYLAVDYGMLSFLSRPLFLVLDFIHNYVGNWGWSIIITTLLIKLAFYKLTATSGRSMAKMRKLAPRMKALQEKHKDDRQALSQAMMELYKKEKVNPAAGCLPLLIQMPFFFAFYWVLVESVEMRQAPFMLWIQDLSVRDPFFILPILMGAAMIFQTRLNPAPPDPVQARVMQIMPVVFSVMFALFPAGLVLYWLTNTVVSIAQQWRINQLVSRES